MSYYDSILRKVRSAKRIKYRIDARGLVYTIVYKKWLGSWDLIEVYSDEITYRGVRVPLLQEEILYILIECRRKLDADREKKAKAILAELTL